MSFFAVKSYADEFRAVIEGKIQSTPVAEDETVAAVAEEIEEQTRDYILKKLAQELKGGSFEDFVAQLLQVMGYKTRQPKRGKGSDGGVDIIAHNDELGFKPPIIKVQVKSKEGTSGDPKVSALYGKAIRASMHCLSRLGTFQIRRTTSRATNRTCASSRVMSWSILFRITTRSSTAATKAFSR